MGISLRHGSRQGTPISGTTGGSTISSTTPMLRVVRVVVFDRVWVRGARLELGTQQAGDSALTTVLQPFRFHA
jgi:hypothetical protein